MKVKMKLLLKMLICLVLAVLLAAASIRLSLRQSGEYIVNGPWRTNLSTGGADAGLYHRARVAWYGLWALQSSEVVYYSANTDSSGQPLRHDCSYRVEGKDPDTRWWSVTAYNDDHFIPNAGNVYSFSKTTVQRETEGSWIIRVSKQEQEKNWLPSGEQSGTMVLSLRCYNPGQSIFSNPATVELPRIIKEGCQ